MLGLTVFFSYETPIALIGPGFGVRRENDWGPTTGRHYKDMSVYDLPKLSGEEFTKRLDHELRMASVREARDIVLHGSKS